MKSIEVTTYLICGFFLSISGQPTQTDKYLETVSFFKLHLVPQIT